MGPKKLPPEHRRRGKGWTKIHQTCTRSGPKLGSIKARPRASAQGVNGGVQNYSKNAPGAGLKKAPKMHQRRPLKYFKMRQGGGECAFFMHGCWGAGIYQSFGNQFKIKTRIILLVGLVATGPLLNPLNRRNSVFGAECVGSRLICGSVRRWWTIFEQSYFRDCKKMVNSGSTFDLLLIK